METIVLFQEVGNKCLVGLDFVLGHLVSLALYYWGSLTLANERTITVTGTSEQQTKTKSRCFRRRDFGQR